jgi:hypothetical protein
MTGRGARPRPAHLCPRRRPWADLGVEDLYAGYIPHRCLGAMHGAMVGWRVAGSLIVSLRRPAETPLLLQCAGQRGHGLRAPAFRTYPSS